MAKKVKLPTDTNKRAKSIVDLGTDTKEEKPAIPASEISRVMSEMGRKGGKKGGPARKAALSAKRRKEIAKKTAAARWGLKN
ncbi:MAG: hypothetical protein WDO71_20120 [Bacteroidota bacterium]